MFQNFLNCILATGKANICYILMFFQLTISDRANLLDDVFALAEANAIKYEIALNLSTYLAVENDFVPWETASAIFDKLSHNILNTDAYENLQVCKNLFFQVPLHFRFYIYTTLIYYIGICMYNISLYKLISLTSLCVSKSHIKIYCTF